MAKNLPEYMGVYKAMILSNTVEATKKSKLPQLKLRVLLTEYYDETEGEWLDVSDDKLVMAAFLVLYDREDNETLNHAQVCKVFDWDGCGFDVLCGDLEGHELQVRVKENADNEKYPVEISWIDEIDADPQGGFKKLDADGINDLNSQFSHLFKKKKAGAKKKVASAKPSANKATAAAKKKAAATAEETGEAEEEHVPTAAEKKAALLAKSRRLKKEQEKERAANEAKEDSGPPPAKKKKAAAGAKKKAAPADGDVMPDDFDKRAAWFTITENRDPECNDDQMKAEWDAAIEEIAPEGDEDLLDAEGWWKIKIAVLANIGKDA
jgi:hypothetical protein